VVYLLRCTRGSVEKAPHSEEAARMAMQLQA
jgi:hypothetical protein